MLGSSYSLIPSRLATAMIVSLVAIATSAAAPTHAQDAPNPAEPARFLKRYIGLSAAEIEQARQGAVVTKVLPTRNGDEVALFGIVAVDVSREAVLRRMRDLPSFLRGPGRHAFGIFNTPATENDVRAFAVEASDMDALRKCRPGQCDVKMPADNIEDFRGLDWSSSTARHQVEAMVRKESAVYVNNYRRGGTSAMVEYADQKKTRSASEAFAELLAQSPYLFDYVPAFHQYVAGYPSPSLSGVTDAIYWADDRINSLRPILSINHVSVYQPPGARFALFSNKQIYASHYFLGAFHLTTVLDRPEAPNGEGVYYMTVQRLRFDNLPGGLLNIRGRVIGKVHDALKGELAQRKTTLEGR